MILVCLVAVMLNNGSTMHLRLQGTEVKYDTGSMQHLVDFTSELKPRGITPYVYWVRDNDCLYVKPKN